MVPVGPPDYRHLLATHFWCLRAPGAGPRARQQQFDVDVLRVFAVLLWRLSFASPQRRVITVAETLRGICFNPLEDAFP